MPIRDRRSGDSRVMSAPLYVTEPLDAMRSPDKRLMSVVFPAPFGPSTACNFPRSRAIATSFTAASPPNRCVSPRAERIVSLIVGPADQCPLEAFRDARQPTGKKNHQQDNRRTEQELPVVGECLENLRERDEGERADDGTIEAPDPAQDQHQQHVARLMPGKKLRIDKAEL